MTSNLISFSRGVLSVVSDQCPSCFARANARSEKPTYAVHQRYLAPHMAMSAKELSTEHCQVNRAYSEIVVTR
jgi:hypothetical protein